MPSRPMRAPCRGEGGTAISASWVGVGVGDEARKGDCVDGKPFSAKRLVNGHRPRRAGNRSSDEAEVGVTLDRRKQPVGRGIWRRKNGSRSQEHNVIPHQPTTSAPKGI